MSTHRIYRSTSLWCRLMFPALTPLPPTAARERKSVCREGPSWVLCWNISMAWKEERQRPLHSLSPTCMVMPRGEKGLTCPRHVFDSNRGWEHSLRSVVGLDFRHTQHRSSPRSHLQNTRGRTWEFCAHAFDIQCLSDGFQNMTKPLRERDKKD